MRTTPNSKLALCVAATLIAALACSAEPTLSGPSGRVAVSITGLDLPGLSGATVAISVIDSLGAIVFHDGGVRSDDHRSADGRVLYIAPCSAAGGPDSGLGPSPTHAVNTIRVELLEVRANDQAFSPATGDVVFPPPTDRSVVCVDGEDVRADFQITFVRRSQQGFVDMVVQIGEVLCSYEMSCEQHAASEPGSPSYPTLVTGFACTDGGLTPSGTNYVGFEGSLCCNGAPPGDGRCTALTIAPGSGAPVWSAPGVGVIDAHSDVDGVGVLGKVFHNTTWRLDPSAVAQGCAFHGRGHFNWSDDGTPAAVPYVEGGDGVSGAPAFLFSTAIANADSSGAMACVDPSVTVAFAPARPEAPALTEGTAFAYGGAEATCLSSVAGLPASAWGWSNGPLLPSVVPRVYPLLAEASHCDLDHGVMVGAVTTRFSAVGTVTVSITTSEGWRLTGSQLHVGAEPTPLIPNGAPTIAPEQFPYYNTSVSATHTYTLLGVSGAVYLVARASVSR